MLVWRYAWHSSLSSTSCKSAPSAPLRRSFIFYRRIAAIGPLLSQHHKPGAEESRRAQCSWQAAHSAQTALQLHFSQQVGATSHLDWGGDKLTEQELDRRICEARRKPQATKNRGPLQEPNGAGEWKCAGCDKFKPTDQFHVNSARKSGVSSWCKACARHKQHERSCTFRANILTLINSARRRACRRARVCTLAPEDLLNALQVQRGRCFYSGVPMECWHPNSHWRMSLERLNNDHGYTPDNVALIAAEFNTTSQSYKALGGHNFGSAQWSTQKVMQLPLLQNSNLDMPALEALVQEARCRAASRQQSRGARRQPNILGEWPCRKCDTFKPRVDFYKSASHTWCKECHRASSFEYGRTLRGNVVRLLQSAQAHSKHLGEPCDLHHGDILDLLIEQRGRCYYSGVPMEYRIPHSHWRMSLERLDNNAGYTTGNCVLIALEFNTSDFSKNKNVVSVSGTAQWSRDKVQYVWKPVRLESLQAPT